MVTEARVTKTDSSGAPATAVVSVKSSWTSKINWTQILSFAASVLVVFGIDLSPETQVMIVAAIQAVQAGITWVLRTFFTKAVTTASVTK